MIAAKLAGINKHHEVKFIGLVVKTIEVITLMADINYLAVRVLDFKLAGERQERRYVAAGPPAR